PGASSIEAVAAMTSGIGDGPDDRDSDIGAAVIGGCRRIEGPGGANLNSFVRAIAAIERRSHRINHADRLAARSAYITAAIGGNPGASSIESIAAVSRGIGEGADDGDGRISAAVIGRCRRIKGPRRAYLNGFVRAVAA